MLLSFPGVDITKIDECVGDPEADAENAVLKGEQDAQVWFVNEFFLFEICNLHIFLKMMITGLTYSCKYICR